MTATNQVPQAGQIWASRTAAAVTRVVSVTDNMVESDSGSGPQWFSRREFLERYVLPPTSDPAPTAADFASDEEFAVYQLGVGSPPARVQALPGVDRGHHAPGRGGDGGLGRQPWDEDQQRGASG
jgi:hypothetical protein